MKGGITISAIGHAAVLLWALVSFAHPLDTKPAESMPIDIVSADEFSKLTAGAKAAPKAEIPKPVVEKIAEEKPVEDLNAKVVEKKTVEATTAESAPTPEPKPKLPEPKPAAAPPQPKTEAKAPEKKEPEQKIDPIAEALKKDDAKKPDKKAETKPEPVKPAPQPQPPKFDPRKVAALLDKRDSQRLATAGAALNSTASLGTPAAASAKMSQTELDALRARLMSLWNPPAGARNVEELIVQVRVRLNPDGSLIGAPRLLSTGQGPLSQAAHDSALRAIYRGQPFDMLSPATYEVWKEMDITFDPRDLARG
jgi:outer membrane biosynthesis protein TonB